MKLYKNDNFDKFLFDKKRVNNNKKSLLWITFIHTDEYDTSEMQLNNQVRRIMGRILSFIPDFSEKKRLTRIRVPGKQATECYFAAVKLYF